ncbi:LOW QUALITY PROTEIN: serine protease FAM111A [Trichechus inunguis]
MSCKNRSQKVSFDEESNRKIDQYFSLVTKKEENNSNIPQMKMGLRTGSRKCPRDITNTQAQRSQLLQENPKDQATLPNKIIITTLATNHRDNENRKHKLTHSERDSLYVALNTLEAFKKEREIQQGKEVLVRGIQGIEGYINLGMPLSCIPEMSHLVITFVPGRSKQGNQVLCRHDETISTDVVKFYIYAIGKGKKKIVKHNRLQKGFKLCIYAFKGETIKDALKDGRFLSFLENDDWKLIENLDTIVESTQLVDDFEGKLFEVEIEKRTSHRAATSQNSESKQRHTNVSRTHIVDQYPSLERQSEKIGKDFQEEMKEGRKDKSLFNLHKENFGKLVSNSTTMKEHKDFSHFGQSVGYIYWDNNGNKGSATCFVFRGLFVLTCQHVINLIVGEVESSKWADIISQCAGVTFAYEEPTEQEKNGFFFESLFEVSDVTVDYAVLELRENGQPVPLGLYDGISPVPLNGLLHIIGHPDGKVKSTDTCLVIPLGQREEKHQEHLQARKAEGYSMQYVHTCTEKSFNKIVDNPDVITDTTFYFGSSGSPVFDSKFSLVAIHTAGFTYEYQNGFSSLIEFVTTMVAILHDIKQKHGMWYKAVCIDQQDVEMVGDED